MRIRQQGLALLVVSSLASLTFSCGGRGLHGYDEEVRDVNSSFISDARELFEERSDESEFESLGADFWQAFEQRASRYSAELRAIEPPSDVQAEHSGLVDAAAALARANDPIETSTEPGAGVAWVLVFVERLIALSEACERLEQARDASLDCDAQPARPDI